VGDYDMDGRLDVFTAGEDGCRLWNNRGRLHFVETFRYTGEMSYTAGPGGIASTTCDINTDGRQDVAIFFSSGIPQIFFNRGFRSFGKSLSLTENNVEGINETAGGQQAGTVEDLNGDGAQDMALVLKDGRVCVFLRQVFESVPPLYARAALPLGGTYAGPLTVTAWAETRCLGAWNVVAGGREAAFGRADAGEVTLKWRFPAGKEQRKVVLLEERSLRILLRPEK